MQSGSLTPEERKTLEVEYNIAHRGFQGTNAQIWQSFSIVGTLALAGLAFIGTLKGQGVGATPKITWPITLAVGFPIIVILGAWLGMMYRWEDYARVNLYRMRQIESKLGIYLIRYGTWLRESLAESKLANLSEEEQAQYQTLIKAFKFSPFWLRQRVLITVVVLMLIVTWVSAFVADYTGVWK